jgi:hypothetical protein
MAAPWELSPVREDTVVDANYGRARTLIEHYESGFDIVDFSIP